MRLHSRKCNRPRDLLAAGSLLARLGERAGAPWEGAPAATCSLALEASAVTRAWCHIGRQASQGVTREEEEEGA